MSSPLPLAPLLSLLLNPPVVSELLPEMLLEAFKRRHSGFSSKILIQTKDPQSSYEQQASLLSISALEKKKEQWRMKISADLTAEQMDDVSLISNVQYYSYLF
jgi:hypothetical protein